METNYWAWWVGGAALATVAILFPLLTGVTLGVSGALARLLDWVKAGLVPTPSKPRCDFQADGSVPRRPDRAANLAFLVAVSAGGALARWVSGQPWGQATLAPEFHRLFGNGLPALLVLFIGGIFVGFGTRWSGGCTSGHGLSGCGRLQPASLVATSIFFSVAIGVSFLLERLLK